MAHLWPIVYNACSFIETMPLHLAQLEITMTGMVSIILTTGFYAAALSPARIAARPSEILSYLISSYWLL